MRIYDRAVRFKIGKGPGDVDRALRYTVNVAYLNVPYYRKLWTDAHVQLDQFHTASDLPRLPVASRASLTSLPEEDRVHQRASLSRCIHSSTSGYLGFPLTVHMNRGEAMWRKLTLLLAITQYVKISLPIRIADVGPMVPRHTSSIEQKLGVVKMLRIPATTPLAEMVERLRRFRPNVVEGYPTCLELLAEELERRGETISNVRLVIARGEVLHKTTRELLEQVFSCGVKDLYSCEEGGNLAWECPVNPGIWHINSDTCVLEVVDDDGLPVPVGAEGRVLLTSLFNATMPFIRYELGDLATMGGRRRCECGSSGNTLISIAGRDDDFLIAPDGRRLSPRLVANTVFNALRNASDPSTVTAGVRQFQVVQESLHHLCLKVVLRTPAGNKAAYQAARALEEVISGASCEVKEVESLPPAPGGKLKKVLSEWKP